MVLNSFWNRYDWFYYNYFFNFYCFFFVSRNQKLIIFNEFYLVQLSVPSRDISWSYRIVQFMSLVSNLFVPLPPFLVKKMLCPPPMLINKQWYYSTNAHDIFCWPTYHQTQQEGGGFWGPRFWEISHFKLYLKGKLKRNNCSCFGFVFGSRAAKNPSSCLLFPRQSRKQD